MDAREQMLRTLEQEFGQYAFLTGERDLDPAVRAAMGRVPREAFVPVRHRARAYCNHPLPIGRGQTISQPFVVALMTALVRPRPGAVVLEVGTGSGYQAAVLAELVHRVYSVEIVSGLALRAERRLRRMGYTNVEVKVGDGHAGWPEHAPYDAIVVTAVAPRIPEALVEQLRPGGRMVIPIGRALGMQQLVLVQKDEDGSTHERDVLPVVFVPLTGEPHPAAD